MLSALTSTAVCVDSPPLSQPFPSLSPPQVLTYSPPGGGILVEQVDKRGNRIAVSEEEERKAGYRAQVRGGGMEHSSGEGALWGAMGYHSVPACISPPSLPPDTGDASEA